MVSRILIHILGAVGNVFTLYIPLILTMSTVFEINVIYKKLIRGYYHTQNFRYQGIKDISNKDELTFFQNYMHEVLQRNVYLQRFGLKRLHLAEFWVIYWMLLSFTSHILVPVMDKLKVPEIFRALFQVIVPFMLFINSHESPSNKNMEKDRPWSFPKLLSDFYVNVLLGMLQCLSGKFEGTSAPEEIHTTIKHINTTLAASDFNIFGNKSKQIFYFEPTFDQMRPTTLMCGNIKVNPPIIKVGEDTSRSSLESGNSPTRESIVTPMRVKFGSRNKLKTRFSFKLKQLFS